MNTDAKNLPPHAACAARTAVLAGTRALVHGEQFDVLTALLVASGAVRKENAAGMLMAMSDLLTGRRLDLEMDARAERMREQARLWSDAVPARRSTR